MVEDDALLASALVQDLCEMGCVPVGPAASLEEALRLAASDPDLDAAVLDLNLRGKTSWPVADILAGHRVPYLFATGYGNLMERRRGAPVLEKPITPAKMSAALRSLIHPVKEAGKPRPPPGTATRIPARVGG